MTLPPSQRAFSRVGSSTRCFSAALPSRAGRRDGWPQPRRHCATATAYVDGVHTQPDDPALAGVPAGNEGQRSDTSINSALPYTPAFKTGDVVYGTVSFQNFNGARADIMYHEGLVGFMPVDQSPLSQEMWAQQPARRVKPRAQAGQHVHGVPLPSKGTSLTVGHTRPFKVLSVPPDMTLNGRGPLLSAYKYDLDMLWARVSQLFELGATDAECLTLTVHVHGYNGGGLLTSVMGLEAFVPNQHISRRPGLQRAETAAALVGTDIEVAPLQLEPFENIRLSETRAVALRAHAQLAPGRVVHGRVRHLTDYGAFVALDGLNMDALLHVSAISGAMTRHAGELFEVGDRVVAVVIEAGGNKVRLSTRLLETTPGELHTDKDFVFARAADGPSVVALPQPEEPRGERKVRGVRGGGSGGARAWSDGGSEYEQPQRYDGRAEDEHIDGEEDGRWKRDARGSGRGARGAYGRVASGGLRGSGSQRSGGGGRRRY